MSIGLTFFGTEFHIRSMQESRLTNLEHDMKKCHIAKLRKNHDMFLAEYDIIRYHMDIKYGISHCLH